MIAVITGDIANSRKINPKIWLKSLKEAFKLSGINKSKWEIFQGDMFQIELNPLDSLKIALLIKTCIKENKHIDVRMAIGIGEKEYSAKRVPESNGQAFVYSGVAYEGLKKKIGY